MNGFDASEVHAARVSPIPPNTVRLYIKEAGEDCWPGYVYGRKFFEKMGAQFRQLQGKNEMLLGDVVYEVDEFAPCGIVAARVIGRRAVEDLQSHPVLGRLELEPDDRWDPAAVNLMTILGMCLAVVQQVEHHISSSFLLGLPQAQAKGYETLGELSKAWKKKTFGQMVRSIEEAWIIEPTLKSNLELFLANRNKLVHGIMVEEQFDIQTHWGREELVAFLSFFELHARIVRRAFKWSFYASMLFAFDRWGRPPEISRQMFGRKHEKLAETFFHFFTIKDQAS